MSKETVLKFASKLDEKNHFGLSDRFVDLASDFSDEKMDSFESDLKSSDEDLYSQFKKAQDEGAWQKGKNWLQNKWQNMPMNRPESWKEENQNNVLRIKERMLKDVSDHLGEIKKLSDAMMGEYSSYQKAIDSLSPSFEKHLDEIELSWGHEKEAINKDPFIAEMRNSINGFQQMIDSQEIDVFEAGQLANQVMQSLGGSFEASKQQVQHEQPMRQPEIGLEDPNQPDLPYNQNEVKNVGPEDQRRGVIMDEFSKTYSVENEQVLNKLYELNTKGIDIPDDLKGYLYMADHGDNAPHILQELESLKSVASSVSKLMKMANKLDSNKYFKEADEIAEMLVDNSVYKFASLNHSLKQNDEELAKQFRQAAKGWWNSHVSDWFGKNKKKMAPEQEQKMRGAIQDGLQSPEPESQVSLTDVVEDSLPKGKGNLPQKDISEGFSNALSTIYNEFEKPVRQIVDLTNTLEDSARKYGEYIENLKDKFVQYREQTDGYYGNEANQRVIDTIWDVINDGITDLSQVLTSPEIDTALVRQHADGVLTNLHSMTYIKGMQDGVLDRKREVKRVRDKERRLERKDGPKYTDMKGDGWKGNPKQPANPYKGPSAFNQGVSEDVQSPSQVAQPAMASSKWKTIKIAG